MSVIQRELVLCARYSDPACSLESVAYCSLGEPTVPIRSPLKEKNSCNITNDTSSRDRSPLKPQQQQTTKTTTTRFTSSPLDSPSSFERFRSASPSKSSLGAKSPSKTSLGAMSSSMSTPGTHRREEETFNREVTETTTCMIGEPKLSPKGTKESYTKTTITETEEKIEKKEVSTHTQTRRHTHKQTRAHTHTHTHSLSLAHTTICSRDPNIGEGTIYK